jgi:uncharacterized protein (DUF1778 family)
MVNSQHTGPPERTKLLSPLKIDCDEESKALLARAAELRHITVSEYVRVVTVAQARREVLAADKQTLALTPEEQLAFWKALQGRVKLTKKQRSLGAIMRGEQ